MTFFYIKSCNKGRRWDQPSHPCSLLIEVAPSFGTQANHRSPRNSWPTVFDHQVVEQVFFSLQDTDYQPRNIRSPRLMEEAARSKDRVQHSRHMTVGMARRTGRRTGRRPRRLPFNGGELGNVSGWSFT